MSYVGVGDWLDGASADSLVECARLLAAQRAAYRLVAVTEPVIMRRFTETGASWALYETQLEADADAAAGGNPARAYGFIRCVGVVTPGTISPAEIAELRGFLESLVRDAVPVAARPGRSAARARLVRAFNALVSTSEII